MSFADALSGRRPTEKPAATDRNARKVPCEECGTKTWDHGEECDFAEWASEAYGPSTGW